MVKKGSTEVIVALVLLLIIILLGLGIFFSKVGFFRDFLGI